MFRCRLPAPFVSALAVGGVAALLTAGCSPATGLRASAAAAPPYFTDATEQAGIRFTHTHGGFGEKYLPETMGAGCGFLDFNGDGLLDILLLNGHPLEGIERNGPAGPGARKPTLVLYRNDGDGTFTDVTPGSGLDVTVYAMGCAIADFDNDGLPDIFVTTCNEPNRLFRNLGEGRFKDVTEEMGLGDVRWGTSAAWVDYDRDGWLDLFVCNYLSYEWGASDRDCFNHPDGRRAYCDPRRLAGQSPLLYRNEGGRRFENRSGPAGLEGKLGKSLGVAICDFDEDGWPDILVANDTEPNFLFHNQADGTFREVGLEAGVALPEVGEVRAGMGIDAAECFNDGRLAVLVTNFSGEGLSLYCQDAPGAMSFTDRASHTRLLSSSLVTLGFGAFFFDYDNDGWLDAFVANGHIQPEVNLYSTHLTHGQKNFLFRNGGNGAFDDVGNTAGLPFTYARVTRAAAYGDFDNDGDLDILIANNNEPAELLRNDGGNQLNWLQIELRGTRSNRDGIGARVEVAGNGTVQRQWVRSGSSYLSQSMLRLHFGLGKADRAERVEVVWPSGEREVLENIPTRQHILVEEGNGMVRRQGSEQARQ
jgi:enediyne biosynthesis protein E4